MDDHDEYVCYGFHYCKNKHNTNLIVQDYFSLVKTVFYKMREYLLVVEVCDDDFTLDGIGCAFDCVVIATIEVETELALEVKIVVDTVGGAVVTAKIEVVTVTLFLFFSVIFSPSANKL